MSLEVLNGVYNVIASSSRGNCVVYKNTVMVDCGISLKKIKENCNLKELEILLITHRHSDHLKISTLKGLLSENKKLKVFCNEDVSNILNIHDIKHTFLNLNDIAKVKNGRGIITKIFANKLKHNVPTYGYHIDFIDFFDTYTIDHATDTGSLKGFLRKGCDLYGLETNYTKTKIDSFDKDTVEENHMDKDDTMNEYVNVKNECSIMIALHKSERNF